MLCSISYIISHICRCMLFSKCASSLLWQLGGIKRCDQERCHFLWAAKNKHSFSFPSILLASFLSCHRNSSSQVGAGSAFSQPDLCSCSHRQREMEAEIWGSWVGEAKRRQRKRLQVFVWCFFTVGTGGHGDTIL